MNEKKVDNYYELLQEQKQRVESKIEIFKTILERIYLQINDINSFFSNPNTGVPFTEELEEDLGIYSFNYESEINNTSIINIHKKIFNHKNARQLGFGEIKRIEDINQNNFDSIKVFLFDSNETTNNDIIKKGTYISLYHIGAFSNVDESFSKLNEFICCNNLKVHDEVYFYCIIGPHCSDSEKDYVLKLFVKLKNE